MNRWRMNLFTSGFLFLHVYIVSFFYILFGAAGNKADIIYLYRMCDRQDVMSMIAHYLSYRSYYFLMPVKTVNQYLPHSTNYSTCFVRRISFYIDIRHHNTQNIHQSSVPFVAYGLARLWWRSGYVMSSNMIPHHRQAVFCGKHHHLGHCLQRKRNFTHVTKCYEI